MAAMKLLDLAQELEDLEEDYRDEKDIAEKELLLLTIGAKRKQICLFMGCEFINK